MIKKSKDAKEQYEKAQENELSMTNETADWIDEKVEGKVDWKQVLEEANANPNKYKHKDQSSTNGDIGIGTDGEPVNLDLWIYRTEGDTKQIMLYNINGCGLADTGYRGPIINGKTIQGKVPQYIKIAGKDEFFPVTDMSDTFRYLPLVIAPEIPSSVINMEDTFERCVNLEIAPKIPSSVINMEGTFAECENLKIALQIPSSVTNMERTFWGCTNLKTAPEIPSSVINMEGTFVRCINLETAPVIPSSVMNMKWTFTDCTSLTGNLVINANPTIYRACLSGAGTKEGANLVLSGTSNILDKIKATKDDSPGE